MKSRGLLEIQRRRPFSTAIPLAGELEPADRPKRYPPISLWGAIIARLRATRSARREVAGPHANADNGLRSRSTSLRHPQHAVRPHITQALNNFRRPANLDQRCHVLATARTVHRPVVRFGTTNWPASLVFGLRACPVGVFVPVMVTFGPAAPEGPKTVPTIVASRTDATKTQARLQAGEAEATLIVRDEMGPALTSFNHRLPQTRSCSPSISEFKSYSIQKAVQKIQKAVQAIASDFHQQTASLSFQSSKFRCIISER